MKIMLEGNVVYLDGEENSTMDIKTLVELAKKKELLVLRDKERWRMLVKKVSITNQIVVLRSTRVSVMRHTHQHHRGVLATLQEVKYQCYWPNCCVDIAQIILKCSICLEKHRVDLHKLWDNMHVDLIGLFSLLTKDKYCYILTALNSSS